MYEAIKESFRELVEFLPAEFKVMPLSRWNESVLRYFFCRLLSSQFPEIEQFTECDKIDLVLKRDQNSSFIEFKFYRHPQRFDPYDGSHRGYKGGPGPKNLAEFRSCVDKLFERPCVPGLMKYIVLVYADPPDSERPSRRRFVKDYQSYVHLNKEIKLELLEACATIEAPDGVVCAQLYQVDGLPTAVAQPSTDSSDSD